MLDAPLRDLRAIDDDVGIEPARRSGPIHSTSRSRGPSTGWRSSSARSLRLNGSATGGGLGDLGGALRLQQTARGPHHRYRRRSPGASKPGGDSPAGSRRPTLVRSAGSVARARPSLPPGCRGRGTGIGPRTDGRPNHDGGALTPSRQHSRDLLYGCTGTPGRVYGMERNGCTERTVDPHHYAGRCDGAGRGPRGADRARAPPCVIARGGPWSPPRCRPWPGRATVE